MADVYSLVESNRWKSNLLLGFFVIFTSVVIWAVLNLLGYSWDIVVVAFVISVLSIGWSYYRSDKLVLSMAGARPADKQQYPEYFSIMQNLANYAQIPMPSLYVIHTPALNAFATGRDPEHAAVAVTSGLLSKLNRSELEAVLAHEVSHIIHLDTRLMTLVALMTSVVGLLVNLYARNMWLFSGRRREERQTNGLLAVVGLLMILLAPMLINLLKLAVSRRREYLADAEAAKITRQPQAMISALQKLSQYNQPMKLGNPAVAELFIVNPLQWWDEKKFAAWFSTHPPIEDRIKALQALL